MTIRSTILAAAALVAAAILPASALERPTGPVILTVKGAITNTNSEAGAEFDLAMLTALASRVTEVETPWTEGKTRFEGPLGRAVLEAVGATGAMLKVTALNDYSADVPAADLVDHDVILATSMNGKPMSVRDKGPLFLIYPFDADPSLYTEQYFNRSVWQIATIEVR
ncbi:molybdopterin-dependent oxidoreductase [Chthonobacter rhizosphaerae]|uniref:molybdopterin-dependent oxidoreductase n=1 Tax=Chthonobacter rhizosphaerae TaxID=2735553 RepID=UPI0015EF4027|nr:molybdopterin-dependent oxidoreductase [Chthonobacter rhizosphaerae]